ncbi:hypothetical protein DdX_22084 [Ditylenchus destructor]|uniref:Uncharacterized protein n=1 Tax=Ditylenchus destructor TaxID=166010 RepID=A0AAD4QV39_9BILA|nr:hypothetical protein DdX_22084 [Ditylenchus destructor]
MQLAETEQIGSIMALAFRIADNLLIDTYRRERRFDSDLDAEWQKRCAVARSRARFARGDDRVSTLLRAMPPLRREVLVRRRLHQQGTAPTAAAFDRWILDDPRHVDSYARMAQLGSRTGCAGRWQRMIRPMQPASRRACQAPRIGYGGARR